MSNRFSCYVIGADTLLIECAELLVKAQQEIRGVISANPRIIDWAKRKNIPVLDPKSDYAAEMRKAPFDYLFSITHLSILPDEVVALPQKCGINFHDGPLPRYAGLNTPAWALMNSETEYGITWHQIASGVDEGDILKQSLFDVAPGETSLSINTRCFEKGIESFGQLIQELAEGREQAVPQDLSDRSYFSKTQRPERAVVIDWEQSAEEIEALIRALDFGPYDNQLGVPKIIYKGQVFAVTRAEVREDEGEPGVILGLSDEEILVGCGEGALAIQGLTCIYGSKKEIAEVIQSTGLQEDDELDLLSLDDASRLTRLNQEMARLEPFWVRRLATLEPIEIPYAGGEASTEPDYKTSELRIPDNFYERYANVHNSLICAFAAYLSRIGGKTRYHLEYSDARLRRETKGLEHLVAGRIPLRVSIPKNLAFDAVIARLNKELDKTAARGTWLHDTIGRHPVLHAKPALMKDHLVPIAVEKHDHPAQFKPSPGTLFSLVYNDDGSDCRFLYDGNVLPQSGINAVLKQFHTFLTHLADEPERPVCEQDLLSDEEREKVLLDWNRTAKDYNARATIVDLFNQQVERTPDAVALVFEGAQLTYRELNERANRLANYLQNHGVGPDKLVGVCVERSLDLMISTLGVQKAGGAYLPLDPAYPKDRLAFMIEDSNINILITREAQIADLPEHNAHMVRVDGDWPDIETCSADHPVTDLRSDNLAYVIYTSGSTGKPKGVMVEHRNAVNFFVGMDERIQHDPPGNWFAVTSLSFDISVLELFYTLTRGFKVVIYLDRDRGDQSVDPSIAGRPMTFGLFYWGNDDGEGRRKYELLLEGAKFADANGFNSVWTPERHFHAFGGPYPNPAVTGAAVAAVTSRLQIRAGSCVLPLHHTIRVAEEWAVIDNLSNGRAGLAIAAGWQPDDFVLRPQNYPHNKKVMFEEIENLRKLWRGEKVAFPGALDGDVEVLTQPRPVQKELPIWVTTAGNPDTYRQAAAIGANVLTHLLGQTVDEVGEKIAIYHQALREHGRDPKDYTVTLMLHTYVGHDDDEVREIVRQPMKDYLGSSVSLVKNYAWAFPAFKRPEGEDASPNDIDLASLTEEELDGILEFAFERYFEDSGLFGSLDTCMAMINDCKRIGVDDIACLIDFGVSTEKVIESFDQMAKLRALANALVGMAPVTDGDWSVAAQLRDQQITHMQCTPSMARMLLMQDDARAALSQVDHVMVGGEALPPSLANDLAETVKTSVTNMYGPTETTIWSSTWRIKPGCEVVSIGTPIANTQLYILDSNRQPVPPGVPGELYIAGDGVVRGYLNRPELTDERFVPNPFAQGTRMYRTGDLVRYREDGLIDFLGRTDHQVKIRGYRIELGEIESWINKHDRVREGVVVAREDTPGDQRLVAYMVAEGDAPSEEDLRELLRAELPEYMVPSHFVFLDAMPLTPNGKIDRKQMPAPEQVGGKSKAEYAAPESELAATLVRLWQETLGKERVGIDDNFFDIGGHSLLVVRLHRMIRENIDKPVAMTDLYRFTTIRTFTEYLQGGGQSKELKQSADRAAKRRESMNRRRDRRGRR